MTSHSIPFNRAFLDGQIADVLGSIAGDNISGNGPICAEVERLLTAWHGSGQSLLTTSCTHALELAALLLNIEIGDEVIVPSYTFTSTAGAFALFGARPVFVDVRHDTLNINEECVRAAITPRTKAVCIVHYAGVAASPDKFATLCAENGLVLIEDNAHGLLGSYLDRPLGTFGALSTMSFHETKNFTCGEGGALHINDEHFRQRAEILREKGTNRSKFFRGEVDKYTWVDVGSSWVLSDLLAAVLLNQLQQSSVIQARRQTIWSRYATELENWAANMGVRLPAVPKGVNHPAHLFHLRLPTGSDRDRFIQHLRGAGISAVFHYQALNTSEAGSKFGGFRGQCPVAEEAAESLVRLPLHLHLSDADVDRVIDATNSFVTS